MVKSVLIIGPHRPTHDWLDPLWQEMEVDKQRFTSTSAALEIMQNGKLPGLVLVSYPLWDSSLDDLLAAMGRFIVGGEPVPVAVLAPEESLLEVAAFEDQRVAVVAEGRDPDDLCKKVRSVMRPSRRAHPRFIVRMAVKVGDGAVLRACQSENMSLSGMLIRTSEKFPVGALVRLTFALPDDEEPLVCQAKVVRYTRPDIEKVRGMAVTFLSFKDEGLDRLEAFLQGDAVV